MSKYKAIAIFGSASDSIDPKFRRPVFETAALLAREGITMIYGVGDGGLMGESYKGTRSENGKVLGITIPSLLQKQCADPSIFAEDELKVADALLIAPGGWGTLDEIASQGVHAKIGDRTEKPMIFLNFDGFWNPIKDLLQQMLSVGAVKAEQIAFIDYADTPEQIFNAIERAQLRLSK